MNPVGEPSSGNHSCKFGPRDLHVFSPVLALIASRRTQTLRRWAELYTLHLGAARTLSDAEFIHAAGALIDTIGDFLGGDLEGFNAKLAKCWYGLAGRGVPFAEAMVLVYLFEHGVVSVIGPKLSKDILTCPLVHEFAHRCVLVIGEAYMHADNVTAPNRYASKSLTADGVFHGLVGNSVPMQRLYEQIEAVGTTGSTTLILGETGTGKELVARAVHECGPDVEGPFVAINCAALPGRLIESELFGHVRGAFTGAEADAQGLFRAADRGTLFLDEITEMSLSAQARLLRAIQERKIRPVGSLKEFSVDVRIVASTNRDPHEATINGLLRHDLYYRLNVAPLHVPPLRERRDDIEPLMWHFIRKLNDRLARTVPIVDVSSQTKQVMQSYAWPGNVRELANAIESALTFSRSDTIQLDDLPETILPRVNDARTPAELVTIAEAERELARRALDATDGNISAAARLLGITRKKLYARMVRYGLTR